MSTRAPWAGVKTKKRPRPTKQIQFLLGHASVQTTERYLGCKQKLRHAVNDNLGLEDS